MNAGGAHWVWLALPVLLTAALWLAARLERRGTGFWQQNGGVVGSYLVVAIGVWALMLVALPEISMIELSFRPKLPPSAAGGPRDVYTLANYRYFLFGSATSTAAWNATHLRAFATTIGASVVVTALDLIVCYPLAYILAKVARGPWLRVLLLLLIAPYWINEVLRAFALRVLFGGSGVLNTALQGIGLTHAPVDFIGDDIAMYAGLVYAYILLMVFPLTNAIESLPDDQIEAARDLGAPWWRIHRDIVMAHARPGLASGCTLVFMLSAGSLAAPLILGGPRTLWFTPIVYDRFYQAFNWPQGAAYALLLLLACALFVIVVLRATRLSLAAITTRQ